VARRVAREASSAADRIVCPSTIVFPFDDRSDCRS